MAKTNIKTKNTTTTYEGAKGRSFTPYESLRRAVLSCLLWENQFYEDGIEITKRIRDLVIKVDRERVANLAIEAREQFNLRHVPLLLVRELARTNPDQNSLVQNTLARIIQRPDEIAEFVSLYWAEGKTPLAAQVKKGLARAFSKFDEYQLAKYSRNGDKITLRDVMFLTHPKPSAAKEELYKNLADEELTTPDTWEVALSAGADKKETFTRLITEGKLGGMAFLRNLRNMISSGVDNSLIKDYFTKANFSRILPFRFFAAAKHAPDFEQQIDKAMIAAVANLEKLPGKTILLTDVSSSMNYGQISSKSELTHMDASAALAALLAGVCEDFEVYTFSNALAKVPPRQGMALRDAIVGSQPHGGTQLGAAIEVINKEIKGDRIVVFTDEQSHDEVSNPNFKNAYIVNVASYNKGINGGAWTRINGFSEAIVRYIQEIEKAQS